MVIKKIDKDELECLVYELQDLIEELESAICLFESSQSVDEIEETISDLEEYQGIQLNHNYPFIEVDLKEGFPSDLKNLLVQVENYFPTCEESKDQFIKLLETYIKVLREN